MRRLRRVLGWTAGALLVVTGLWYAGAAVTIATAGSQTLSMSAPWVPESVSTVGWNLWPYALGSPELSVDQPVTGWTEADRDPAPDWVGDSPRLVPFEGVKNAFFPPEDSTTMSALFGSQPFVQTMPLGPGRLAVNDLGGSSTVRMQTAIVVAGHLVMATTCGLAVATLGAARRGRTAVRPARVLLGVAGLALVVVVPALTLARLLVDRALLAASDVAGQYTVSSPWTLANLWPVAVGLVLLAGASAGRTTSAALPAGPSR